MKWLPLSLCCLCVVLLTSCRMADGPVPDPKDGETANRVGDLSRDLSNVAAGHADATQDFMDDLLQFVDLGAKPDAAEPVKELGNQLIAAFSETKATERAVVPLLERVVVGLMARTLSEKQVEQVRDEVRQAAIDLGVDDVKARALASQIEIVQRAVTDRHRRWYEVF